MNMVFEEMYQRVYESIREGETIAQPLKESRLVDDMVVNMVDVGEETGDLDTMLYKIADVYDEEVDVLVESLISLLEPIMIVILGFIVGTIVIALFMPCLGCSKGFRERKSRPKLEIRNPNPKQIRIRKFENGCTDWNLFGTLGFRISDLFRISRFGFGFVNHAETPMKYQPKSRSGFTLIELLMVIAIIVILVSLLLAGVFYAFSR